MKKLIAAFLIFPSVFFGNTNTAIHSNLLFEENIGQVSCKNFNAESLIHPIDGKALLYENSAIRFILKGSLLTYYFSDRGYSIVQKDNLGNLNRTDFYFDNDVRIQPIGEVLQNSASNYYLASGHFIAKRYSKIVYQDIVGGITLEFAVKGDAIEKTIISNTAYLFRTNLFHCVGSIVTEGEAGNQLRYSSAAGFFNETLSASKMNVQMSISTISWLTYLGGTNSEDIFGITLAADSGVVVTGRTGSIDYPTTVGSMQDSLSLSYDAVITRFDKNGNCLWSTYYGGTNFDGAYQVVTIGSTFVICGMTSSTDLPMLAPTQVGNNGSYDAFLLVLDWNGQLVRSTYYGGSGGDQGICLAKGPGNEIVLGGSATSTDLPFASSGFQATMAGQIDAFLAVFDNSLNVIWSTYYGGSNSEDIHSLCITPQQEIAFLGATQSFDFPVTANAWQMGLLNQPDNYLVKFGMDGSRHYATFFGGTNMEDANGITADAVGNLYCTGFTFSVDFPTLGTIFQPNLQGQSDIYVSKFDVNGQLVWSTFVGGAGQDVGYGIHVLGKYIFICGQTESPTFPVSANAIQSAYAMNGDGFVIKMDTSGQMITGTFMGGNGGDGLLALTVDADTNVIACGSTYSTDLPVLNPFQLINASNGDGYVVKFGMAEELLSTSIQTINNNVSVFPNPTNDYIFVSTEGRRIAAIEIVDVSGRTVLLDHSNTDLIRIDCKQLVKGVYFIKITEPNLGVQICRFIRN